MNKGLINRHVFAQIFEPEFDYYGKTFKGEGEEEKAASKRNLLRLYYESLAKWPLPELEEALKRCRERCEYFPKLKTIIENRPRLQEVKEPDKYVSVPMPDRVRRTLSAPRLYRVDDGLMKKMQAMCRIRWPGSDWTETFARWERDNSKRPERAK